jgi:hypothetical protein
MGITRRRRQVGLGITKSKLQALILEWLDKMQVHIAADFDPDSEIWRQMFAQELSIHLIGRIGSVSDEPQQDKTTTR